MNYIKRFVNSDSAPALMPVFSISTNPYKEITESFGMLEAAKRFISNIDESKVIVIGDGRAPRTGALFAYFTKAEVVSIDPAFDMLRVNEYFDMYHPQRLAVLPFNLESVVFDGEGKQVITIWPHSHAPMDKLRIENFSALHYIALPCCVPVPPKFMRIPHIVYEDKDILSAKRTVHIWRDLKAVP